MFKIQENSNGTTSIFCTNSGKLLCTLHSKTSSKQINLVAPCPAKQKSPPLPKKEPAVYSEDEDVNPNTKESKCCLSPMPLGLWEKDEPMEDFSDECITQDEFARCINLVPHKRFEVEPREELLNNFPLRQLSRSGAFRTENDTEHLKGLPDFLPMTSCLGLRILKLNEPRNFTNDQRVQVSLKRYDSFCRWPFSGGLRSPAPNFPKLRCRDTKSYQVTFSQKGQRHVKTHYYSCGRRQRKERMRTIRAGLTKQGRMLRRLCRPCNIHLQRLTEEEIKIWTTRVPQTEVDEESDGGEVFVLSHIQSTQPRIKEKAPSNSCGKLKSKQDPDWVPSSSSGFQSQPLASKGSGKSPINTLCKFIPSLNKTSQIMAGCSGENLPEIENCTVKRRSVRPGVKYRSVRQHQLEKLKCKVKLNNVLKYIHQRPNGKYYIRGTNIAVPFYSDYLLSKHIKQEVSSTSDHDYYITSQNSTPSKQKGAKQCLHLRIQKQMENPRASNFTIVLDSEDENSNVGKQVLQPRSPPQKKPSILLQTKSAQKKLSFDTEGKSKMEVASGSQKNPTESLGECTKIPIIDLTVESPPRKDKGRDKYLVSQWIFRCFGCKTYAKHFYSNNLREAHCPQVEAHIVEHMKKFHMVLNPEGLLTRYLDSVNRSLIVEAFPGFH